MRSFAHTSPAQQLQMRSCFQSSTLLPQLVTCSHHKAPRAHKQTDSARSKQQQPQVAGQHQQQEHSESQQQQQQKQHKRKQKPVVRPITEADKEAWLALFKDYITWYKASVPDDIIELTWQRIMAGGEGNHQALVAEDSSGKLVGLAHILLHRSTWSATHYCYLEDLYVHHGVRGGGVGEALIEAVYAAADQQGATKTYWQTHERNYRARGLYDKMGTKSEFILYGRN